MSWIDLGRAALCYRLEGEAGPVVVLLHEMAGALESWDGVVPHLADRRRVLRYDMRGAGQSETLRADISVEAMVDDLAALLDALGLTEPVAVVGNAVGAAVALCFAGRYPERTSAVAVMSAAVGVPPSERAPRLAFADSITEVGMRGIVEVSLAGGYPEVLRRRAPERFAEFRARWLCNDPASFRFVYRMLVYMDIEPWLARIACPVLGIGCTLDPVRTPAYVRGVVAKTVDHRFVEIESGHHTPVQTPELVAGALLPFLDEVQPAPPTRGRTA
jgi:3-oxoadipate enol-lactonase